MNPRLFIAAFTLLYTVSSAFADPSDQEIIALMNRVQARVAAGDTNSLNDLTTLPGQYAAPGFLTIFKQNPNDKAVRSKCAQLAVTTPGGEQYIVTLLKGKPANNSVFFQQDAAIKCLVLNHNATSVRILGGSLDDVDPEEIGPRVTRALTTLNLPGSPMSTKDRVSDAVALTKWKQWWSANKGNYTAKPAP